VEIAQAFRVSELWRHRGSVFPEFKDPRQPGIRKDSSAADARRPCGWRRGRARLDWRVPLLVGGRGVFYEFPIDDILRGSLRMNLRIRWQELKEFTTWAANDTAERANLLTDNFS
jgi:hypothetical protein